MNLTFATNFEMDNDSRAEVIAALPDGRAAMTVVIEFEHEHRISYQVHDAVSLSHPSIARVILGASDLIDSFFTGEPSVWDIEV